MTYGSGPREVHGVDMPVGSFTTPLATAVIDLDPDEYFISISGTRLSYAPSPPISGGVASLNFITNKQVFGPFGIVTSNPFEVRGPIYSFHGAAARGATTEVLTAIGFWRLPPGKQPGAHTCWLSMVAGPMFNVRHSDSPSGAGF